MEELVCTWRQHLHKCKLTNKKSSKLPVEHSTQSYSVKQDMEVLLVIIHSLQTLHSMDSTVATYKHATLWFHHSTNLCTCIIVQIVSRTWARSKADAICWTSAVLAAFQGLIPCLVHLGHGLCLQTFEVETLAATLLSSHQMAVAAIPLFQKERHTLWGWSLSSSTQSQPSPILTKGTYIQVLQWGACEVKDCLYLV